MTRPRRPDRGRPDELVPTPMTVDLTGLRAEYDVRDPRPLRERARLGFRAVALGLVAVACGVAAWWGGAEAVVRVLGVVGLVAFLRWMTDHPRWCARTRLEPEVPEVKDGGIGRGDRYRWWFVREITCRPGRAVPGRAVLGDGRRLRLHGMPADEVDRLAEALERARAAANG
ncbi:hypothetical protein [Pseudokineococcus lusitanus]|uniref:DUF2244 domain-containing protein n=1 Tax=Pseudokineococcus lusitanus TaxID=763993 RepID=A0A3N1GAN7_9ACTN|nr:hypothetical protein [Pseudokineococcus lusitanus]ROP27305.1 hypothetical protein EDC03_2830 [Pseudokineococcus lusitanus]